MHEWYSGGEVAREGEERKGEGGNWGGGCVAGGEKCRGGWWWGVACL